VRLLSVLAVFAVCKSSPTRTTDMPSPPTSTGDAPAADPADAAAAAEVPDIDLGAAYQAIGFVPGRFAVVIAGDRRGTHARNWVTETSRASLVLELASDGAATACRGWNYMMWNDGPTVHTRDRFREQAGFRGRYTVRGGVVEAELSADPTVCPSVAEYSLVPRRSTVMKLRCVRARRTKLSIPVLLCDWRDADTSEVTWLRVDGAAPSPWIVLGADPGVLVSITGAPFDLLGDPVQVAVEASPAAIEFDAWHTGW